LIDMLAYQLHPRQLPHSTCPSSTSHMQICFLPLQLKQLCFTKCTMVWIMW